jgi:two-component system, chemotaxis family, sensor kinase CheA
LPLLRLHRMMRNSGDDAGGGKTWEGRYAVVASSGERAIGIVVDEFVGRREVVVKPIGRFLRDIPGVAGATDLGDATAVLVLDPESLIAGDRDVRTAS